MKCPKCGYLGFEQVDRCRNCRYDFSLHAPSPDPDFAIRRETETVNPLDDLPLIDAASVWTADRAMIHVEADLDRVFGAEEPAPQRAAVAPMSLAAVAELPRGLPREELPLFGPPIPDDEPLITKASPPRPPLAVRRATPEMPRLRSEPATANGRASIWRLTSPTRRHCRSCCRKSARRRPRRGTTMNIDRTPASARACSPSCSIW